MLDSNPIFIGGVGRSGTTLLYLMLNSHSQLAIGPELHFLAPPDLGRKLIETCWDLSQEELSDVAPSVTEKDPIIHSYRKFAMRCKRWGISYEELMQLANKVMEIQRDNNESAASRCVLFEGLGKLRCKRTNKKRWGGKIMQEVGAWNELWANAWPNAQLIHIIRDGRDVAASQLCDHKSWSLQNIGNTATLWAQMVNSRHKVSSDPRCIFIRYEDLVLKSKETMEEVLKFLDVPWEDGVLKHTEADQELFKNHFNHPSYKQALRPINASSIGRYKRDLSRQDINIFEEIAGVELAELGYRI